MTTPNPIRVALLWAGLLGGPVSWSVQLLVVYTLAAPACGSGQLAPLHLMSALCLASAAGCGWVAWRAWRTVGGWPRAADDPATGRVKLMAVLGMMSGILFSLTIAAQWSAVMFLPPCHYGAG